MKHLNKIFNKLVKLHINLALIKSYISFSDIKLLKQWVDSFDISINKIKLEAFSSFKFSWILQQLKNCLNLVEWFRNYIYWYFQITKSLKKQKKLLMKSDLKTNRARKIFSKIIQIFLFSLIELKIFNILQKIFNDSLFFLSKFNLHSIH